MRDIKGLCLGVMTAALLLGTGCKPNQSVAPNDPAMNQGTGGSGMGSGDVHPVPRDTGTQDTVGQDTREKDSSLGTGTGGSGMSHDTSPLGSDSGTGGAGDSQGVPGGQQGTSLGGKGGGGDSAGMGGQDTPMNGADIQGDHSTREPASGTTEGNDSSHRDTDPGADQGLGR
ncbi:hypothetical protein [Melittangium boletus]|uniref:hypothetical protein n=1 Tax=Melittangium boletus TaxID=83453 RepID=UPI003DA5ABB8